MKEKDRILHLIRDGWYITEALDKVGVTSHMFYQWREDEEFDNKVQEAIDSRNPDTHSQEIHDLFDGECNSENEVKRRSKIMKIMKKFGTRAQ